MELVPNPYNCTISCSHITVCLPTRDSCRWTVSGQRRQGSTCIKSVHTNSACTWQILVMAVTWSAAVLLCCWLVDVHKWLFECTSDFLFKNRKPKEGPLRRSLSSFDFVVCVLCSCVYYRNTCKLTKLTTTCSSSSSFHQLYYGMHTHVITWSVDQWSVSRFIHNSLDLHSYQILLTYSIITYAAPKYSVGRLSCA